MINLYKLPDTSNNLVIGKKNAESNFTNKALLWARDNIVYAGKKCTAQAV